MPKMPPEVGKDETPDPLPITKPRRETYAPGAAGTALWKEDLAEWNSVRRQTPQGIAGAKLFHKNLTGNDQ